MANTHDDVDVVYDDNSEPSDQLKKIREKLNTCVEEKQEYLDGWQRAKAELVNVKKRLEEDKKSFAQFATENLVHDLLPVLDGFDMAMKNKEAWESAPEGWRKGVEYIYDRLKTTLENHGVTCIDPMNTEFNSHDHESIETVAVDDKKLDNTIVDVVMKGYAISGKIVRAPKVRVGKFGEN